MRWGLIGRMKSKAHLSKGSITSWVWSGVSSVFSNCPILCSTSFHKPLTIPKYIRPESAQSQHLMACSFGGTMSVDGGTFTSIYGTMSISGGTMSNGHKVVEPWKKPWTKFMINKHFWGGAMNYVYGTMDNLYGTMNSAGGTIYNAYKTMCN